ncbi:unnamed protein product [Eruca vesicaria subsp. sativa]|uniref:Elicitor peptide 3 n=1 Tax=Eruca vesicaria subsp. sativa TaxID=29727 RepID=A0ABC8M6B9_ERUVS|nr:unnamed protein product [Eruca vesicaria subsp. sativa]
MENMRDGEENGSHWIPFMFFDRSYVTIHLLKWFGLGSYSPSSSFSSHSEKEEEDVMETKEEGDDMTIEITERGFQKHKPKPKPSSGKGGKVH